MEIEAVPRAPPVAELANTLGTGGGDSLLRKIGQTIKGEVSLGSGIGCREPQRVRNRGPLTPSSAALSPGFRPLGFAELRAYAVDPLANQFPSC